jgi:nitroreductase
MEDRMAAATPFQKIVRSRRSIRRFLPDAVEKEKILACLDAARLAPSAHNAQPWRFVVVDDPSIREILARGAFSGLYAMTKFAVQAPVLVVILAKPDLVAHRMGGTLLGTRFHLVDIGIAGEHFVLQAEELGLATCWIGWFNARKTRKILKIPSSYKIGAILAVGYAVSRPPAETKRKGLEEIAWFNAVKR